MKKDIYRDFKGRRRVVITGLGVISPLGNGHQRFWERLLEGKNAATKITSFDTSKFKSNIACEIKDFNFKSYCNNSFKDIGRASQLAIAATLLAIKDSSYILEDYNTTNIGVSLGTTSGEVQILHNTAKLISRSKSPQPNFCRYVPHNIPTNVAKYFGLTGPNIIVPTACAASNYAIGIGTDMIRQKRADMMIVGGVDPIDSIVFAGFSRIFSIAPELCQPFDINRKGLLIGEGAAILILESLEKAVERDAKIYTEIIGYGLSCDAFHMTNPDPNVNGTYNASLFAFSDSNISADNVDCIIAHGTGTRANDRAETKLIKRIFGENARYIPISANKSMLGHTMGAAGGMNAIMASRILTDGYIPPTINLRNKDPECDLDYVPNETRKADVHIVQSNAFAFGGNNSIVLFKKWN